MATSSNSNPTDVARETLKLLATRRIAPTPQNYQRIYHEISGTLPEGADSSEQFLQALQDASAANPGVPALATLARAAQERNWDELSAALATLAGGKSQQRQDWGGVIREVMRQIEMRQTGVAAARKRDGLEQLLIRFGSDPMLHDKLQALVRSWGQNAEPAGVAIETAGDPSAAVSPAPPARASEVRAAPAAAAANEDMKQLKDLFAQALEVGVAPRLEQRPALAGEARSLAQQWRDASGMGAYSRLASQLKQFWYRVETSTGNDADLLDSLRRLLGLLVNNISELVDDDQWVSGQLAVVTQVINQPLTAERILQAERSFKEVVYKQSMLKHSLREAKFSFKNLITVFVERLSEMTSSTTGYHTRMEGYSERLKQSDDVGSLQTIVNELMTDTRSMQADMLRRRDEMIEARQQAEQAETRVRQLEAELQEVSEQVREDQLTGTLNRRGLDDAMQRELARAERRNTPVCVAVLDIDNFKKLNDTYGHQAGDEALIHLSGIVRRTLRPTDIVARFGGEEFIIVFGDTEIAQAVDIMQRLQRELTKRFFLHNNERMLITFSAGVAALRVGDTQETIFARADKAMYQAKVQGKNRVMIAQE